MKPIQPLLFTLFILLSASAMGQSMRSTEEYQPTKDFDNIHVVKMDDDSLATTFMIWVKRSVKEHYHAHHTEVVYVLEGTGTMSLGNQSKEIKPGDYIFIPKGTHHSVTVSSNDPMKVISIQSPRFDGSDRVFVSQK